MSFFCTHLIERVEVVLHALDGDVLAILDALRLEHLREGALALFADQAVPARAVIDGQRQIYESAGALAAAVVRLRRIFFFRARRCVGAAAARRTCASKRRWAGVEAAHAADGRSERVLSAQNELPTHGRIGREGRMRENEIANARE